MVEQQFVPKLLYIQGHVTGTMGCRLTKWDNIFHFQIFVNVHIDWNEKNQFPNISDLITIFISSLMNFEVNQIVFSFQLTFSYF